MSQNIHDLLDVTTPSAKIIATATFLLFGDIPHFLAVAPAGR
jgi:hypothetical protein